MNEALSELELAISETEGISDILGIIADYVAEGAGSLDNYNMGFYQISNMIFNNVKKLNDIKEKLYKEYGKVVK